MSTPHRPAARLASRLLPLGMAVASPVLAVEPVNLEAVNVSGTREESVGDLSLIHK